MSKTPDDELNSVTGQVWDRLDGEPMQAWNAFKDYRDTGLTRSSWKTAVSIGKSRGTIAGYSSTWNWVSRAAAYDAEQDRLDQLLLQDERRKAAVRHVRQAQALNSKWLQRLQTLDPNELTPSEVLRYAEIATKMEREALRLNDVNVNVNVDPTARVEAMSASDVQLRLAALKNEIDNRMLDEAEVEDE